MEALALAQILDQDGKTLVVESCFNFLEEAVQRTVDGEKGLCFVCGECANKLGDFICPACFKGANKEEAGRGVDMARAAISVFIKAGGTTEHRQSRQEIEMIDNDFFRGIVGAGKEWCKENPDATVQQVIEHLIFVFNDVDKNVVGKAGTIAHKFSSQHQELWNNAVEAVAKWYKENLDDFRSPSEVGRDIMTELKPQASEGKVIAAVKQHQGDDEFQKRKKSRLFQRCEGIAGSYLGKTFDNRHPGEIAQEIIDNRKEGDPLPQSILPMLTRAVANQQDELRQAERKRLIASYSGGQKVKKPGSAARRHNGHSSKVRMAGAKKRGVKG